MKCALALCLMLFAIGVMTNPFKKDDRGDTEELTRAEKERQRGKFDNFGAEKRADEELTRAEKERQRGKFDNFGAEKRGDEEKEYKREEPEVEYKRSGSQSCVPTVGLWPEGKVQYAFCDASIKTTAVAKALETMKELFSGFLEFVDTTEPDYSCGEHPGGHYIAFQHDADGCWSYIGKTSGINQALNLQTSACESAGVIMHEMIHALGSYHTQQRPDASDYIETVPGNIKTGKEGNFEPKSTMCTNCKYQTCSIMHYRSSAFASGGKTILSKIGAMMPGMGQQNEVEAGDLCYVFSLYAAIADQKTCAGNGDLCCYGTGKEYYNFDCCRCPPNLKGELCNQFHAVTANDEHYEVPSDGSVVTIKSQVATNYDASSTTTYFITTDESCKLKMTVIYFSVEADADCYWDQFYFWNTTSILDCPGTLCGTMPAGRSYLSEKNFMMIKLVSDEMYQEKGFEFEFKAVECS